NVHLAPAWLGRLEKRLETLRPHGDFRLFLTMEINPAVPASLLRRARTLLYEPATGLRANLLESLRTAGAAGAAGAPAERTRLRFQLAWLHAVVIERLRYAPLGWSHRYEFSDADFTCALATVDAWVTRAAQGRANIAPERIPWDAIRTLLVESVYGGRIDSAFDQRVLAAFVARWFCADAYGADFALVDEPSLRAPEGTCAGDFERWCLALPESQPPTWLGLPPNAETLLLVQKGQRLLADVRKLRALMDDDDDEEHDDDAGGSGFGLALVPEEPHAAGTDDDSDNRAELPAYMRQVAALAAGFARILPETLPALAGEGDDAAATPLLRVMERENSEARALLARVRGDLALLGEVCSGRRKQTNHLRRLLADFNAGTVPAAWLAAYVVPRDISLSQWVADFGQRLAQGRELAAVYAAGAERAIHGAPVWLGGLLFPEAFITATRQAVAKQLACSLEELHIGLVPDAAAAAAAAADHVFRVRGLRLEGAQWIAGGAGLALNDGRSEPLPISLLTWTRGEPAAGTCGAAIPVYLNGDRSSLLFEARLPAAGGAQRAAAIVERAVAITAA
ncbi:dynein heavy chain, partial [Coemansia spiralis]